MHSLSESSKIVWRLYKPSLSTLFNSPWEAFGWDETTNQMHYWIFNSYRCASLGSYYFSFNVSLNENCWSTLMTRIWPIRAAALTPISSSTAIRLWSCPSWSKIYYQISCLATAQQNHYCYWIIPPEHDLPSSPPTILKRGPRLYQTMAHDREYSLAQIP